MTPYSLSTFGILLILLALSPFWCKAFHNPEFQLGLEKLQYFNVTPKEINDWWTETQKKRSENQPRVFPLCIDEDPKHGWPPAVKPFGHLFKTLKLVKKFKKEEHTWASKKSTDLVKNMKLYQMTAKIKHADITEERVLDQWITIELTVERRLRGLYIQSIGGPLGIPVGEFVDIRCTTGSVQPANLLPFQHFLPCSFSPRVSETTPNVFIMDYSKLSGSGPRRLFFQFKWSEAQCQEIGYFQFIIIATASFNSIEPVLSPIYRFNDIKTGLPTPTPHHQDYNLHCDSAFIGGAPFTIINDGETRIIPNKEYDNCILDGVGRGTTEIEQGTCPPGHFTCATMWKTKSEWNNTIEKYFQMFVNQNNNFQDCCEIGPIKPPPITTPSPSTTTEPTTEMGNMTYMSSTSEEPLTHAQIQMVLAVKQDKALEKKARRNEKIHQVTHGDLCILVWLVLIPMSDHISRFLKDLPDFKSVGLGFWIIAHIGLHSGGVILVWLSFGLVVGSGDDKLGNVGVRHFLLGFICTAIQHAQFITGLKRNLKERESFYYVLSHSLSGYISHFFGLVDVALSNAGNERKWLSVGFFLVWLSCTVASYYVEKVQDRRIGMTFHRPQCPVLQRVMMEERKNPPLMGVKLGILAFMVITQLSMFTVMMVYYEASATVDMKIQELHQQHNIQQN